MSPIHYCRSGLWARLCSSSQVGGVPDHVPRLCHCWRDSTFMLGGAGDHARQSAGVTVCTCWSSASRGDTQQLGRAAGLVPCPSGPWNVLQGCRASVAMLPRWARLEAMLSSWWDGLFASLPRQECRMCSISGSSPWTGDPRQAGLQLRCVARGATSLALPMDRAAGWYLVGGLPPAGMWSSRI